MITAQTYLPLTLLLLLSLLAGSGLLFRHRDPRVLTTPLKLRSLIRCITVNMAANKGDQWNMKCGVLKRKCDELEEVRTVHGASIAA